MKKSEKEVLQYLNQQKRAVKSIEIANALHISSRSVKNYVSNINGHYKKKIILSSHAGYELNRQISVNLLYDDFDNPIPQTTEERIFYIIKQLILYPNSFIELFELCEYLCISYSTIKSVLSVMNRTFASYHVKFLCENDCLKIDATEKDKRALISYVINAESKASYIDTSKLQECFPDIDVMDLRSMLLHSIKIHNYYLNDFAATNLLLHILIMIDREKKGNVLDTVTSSTDIANEYEYQLLQEICQKLEKSFKITLNQNERSEIYMLIRANANYSLPNSTEELEGLTGADILDLTDDYICRISSLYLIDLKSTTFRTAFSLHLKNLLFRAKNNNFTSNPMTDSIRFNNPIVFDIAIYIGLDLAERYHFHINEDEIAFLAMHIGAEIERQNENKSKVPCVLLCPDYLDMCKELLNTLLLNYGNQIDLIKVAHSLNDLDDTFFSIMFTTVPVYGSHSYRTVSISPFNVTSQFETIQNAIIWEQNKHKNYILKNHFQDFFESDLFIANSNMKEKTQILNYLCDRLLQKNYVDSNFKQNVFRRENISSTAFGNIAIPHSVNMDAIKTSIAVGISKEGFLWGDHTVHLVLLLAINRADKKTFRELYESLINLFGMENILQETRSCNSLKDFEHLIYNYIVTNNP